MKLLCLRFARAVASLLGAALLLAGCASAPPPVAAPSDRVLVFSDNPPGRALPAGWLPLTIAPNKKPTRYDLVRDPATQRVVLHAIAERSASGLRHALDLDPAQQPWVTWQWRVVELIDAADNTDRHAEDAPVRLLLFFDGDHARLPARERQRMELAQLLTGQTPPYATLIYLWENRQPVGTIIDNAHTGRIKMVVAGSGMDGLGQWRRFERDYVADFERAFGERPGRLLGVGILTDTDNTGERVEAFYGDIAFVSRP